MLLIIYQILYIVCDSNVNELVLTSGCSWSPMSQSEMSWAGSGPDTAHSLPGLAKYL